MEYIQQEPRTHIALASISSDPKPVYMSTTIPVVNNNRGDVISSFTNHNNQRHQHSNASAMTTTTITTGTIPKDDSSEASVTSDSTYTFPHFTSLPSREPLDIQFKDVSYTVNLGYFKGEFFFCSMTF